MTQTSNSQTRKLRKHTPNQQRASVKGIGNIACPPMVAELLQSYYGEGFNLDSLPGMTPEELAGIVDYLRQSEWMDLHLDTLEEHFKTYIKRQISYNQFVTRVVKAGLAGAEKIDKSSLDTYLAHKGYTANAEKLTSEKQVSENLINAEVSSEQAFQNHRYVKSLEAMRLKYQSQVEAINNKPGEQEERSQVQAAVSAEKKRIQELFAYGTGSKESPAPKVIANKPVEKSRVRKKGRSKVTVPQKRGGITQFFTGK